MTFLDFIVLTGPGRADGDSTYTDDWYRASPMFRAVWDSEAFFTLIESDLRAFFRALSAGEEV